MRHLTDFLVKLSTFLLLVGICITLLSTPSQANSATTTSDPDIPLDELGFMLTPMTSDELIIEADGWLALLKETANEISKVQLEVKQKNLDIEIQEEKAKTSTSESAEEKTEKVVEEEKEEKIEILKDMNILQAQKISRIDRLNAVLSAITQKVGMGEGGKEPEQILPYRRYINAISGVQVDVTDIYAAWVNIYGWMVSAEGGIRWLMNILAFVATIVAFWGLSKIVGKAVKRALTISPSNSTILNDFLINSSRRLMFFIGLLVGLSALEINIGPVIAIIGAASFVVAFALQGTLSNFASGIMIMFYRPFDVGDLIDVSGQYGTVKSMTLVSTSVMTLDNKLMVVPNNDIWGKTITNATKSLVRRVDMVFGIGYSDDIEKATQVMYKILTDHPNVLSTPEPVVKLHELGNSSVNFICRPWAKTPDYWDVYWDVTRQVKERFDAEGITIPFPQRDIHLYNETT